MKAQGVSPNCISLQGVLIATARLDKKDEALRAIEEALETNVRFNQPFCMQAIKSLFPELRASTVTAIRETLRTLSEEDPDLRDEYLELGGKLRLAEFEDTRRESQNVKDIEKRQAAAWRAVLVSLVEVVESKGLKATW